MVRDLTVADIDLVAELLKVAHDESEAYRGRDYSEPMARGALEAFAMMPDAYAKVREVHGEIVGILICMLSPLWWKPGNDAVVMAAYVLPAHRGAGLRMLFDLVRWAKALGSVERLSIGVSFGGDTGERSGRLFETKLFKRMGFVKTGSHFMLEV